MIKAWKGQKIAGYELDQYFTAIKNPLFFLCFPKMMQSFRKLNTFKVESQFVRIILDMLLMCLSQAALNFNVSVPLELINMAGTYYHLEKYTVVGEDGIKEKTKKVYLMNGIKDHKIFKNFDFWHASLIYTIAESKDGYDFHDVRYSIE